MIFIDYQDAESAFAFKELVANRAKYIYFKYLEWDSSFFDKPSFLLDVSKSDFEPSDELAEEIKNSFKGAFISTKIDTQSSYEIVYFLQKCGFYYVDTEIELKFDTAESIEYKNTDIKIEEKSVNSGLPYDLLGSVFNYTRFHTDINIKNSKADKLWVSYLENYRIDSKHRMFVALSGCVPCGVILVNSSEAGSVVFFVSILDGFRGKNIGSIMMHYVLDALKDRNIYTETQAKNISALNFYIKNGFKKINKTITVLHRWDND